MIVSETFEMMLTLFNPQAAKGGMSLRASQTLHL
jgi:hypothetical protein